MALFSRFIRYMMTAVLGVSLIVLTSCQKEIPEKIIFDDSEVIATGSELADLIRRITLTDGSADDILDNANCLKIVFPISGYIEDNFMSINSLGELQTLGLLAREFEIQFPINVELSDYRVVSISSELELENFSDACIRDGSDEDIECVDFSYPIKLKVYNKEQSVFQSRTIFNDREFFGITITSGTFFSLEYPLILKDKNSLDYVVTSNSQLEQVILNLEGSCDEQDDREFENIDQTLYDLLVDNNWVINYFFDSEDLTDTYTNYLIDFATMDRMSISGGAGPVTGEWYLDFYDESNFLEIGLETEEEFYTKLNHDWKVMSYSDTQISLEAINDADESIFLIIETTN